MPLTNWTIEEHGDGYALYSGRVPCKSFEDMSRARHGLNLLYLKDPDKNFPEVKLLIENAPELLKALYNTHKTMLYTPSYKNSNTCRDNELLLSKLTDCLSKQKRENR